MPARRPKAILFDLDGTLVDSFADIATALNATRARYGLAPLPETVVRAAVGSGSEALVRRLVVDALAQQPARGTARDTARAPAASDALAAYLAHYDAVALAQTRACPGVDAVLAHFGALPLAVVTNKTLHLSRKILRGLGLWERFRLVLGGDSLPRRKPDPLPLRHALACFAVAPAEALMVGDGLHDLVAARCAGVPAVAVTGGVESPERLAAERPAALIARLDELIALCG